MTAEEAPCEAGRIEANSARDVRVPRVARIETPWLTTTEAAEYCRMAVKTLQKQVERGNIIPDSWGKRGRTSTHRFLRDTLDRFLRGE